MTAWLAFETRAVVGKTQAEVNATLDMARSAHEQAAASRDQAGATLQAVKSAQDQAEATTRQAGASLEAAKAAYDQAEAARRQAAISAEALRSSVRPLLTHGSEWRSTAVILEFPDGYRFPNLEDDDSYVFSGPDPGRGQHLSLVVKNIGGGVAVVEEALVCTPGVAVGVADGSARGGLVPAGGTTRLLFAVPDSSNPQVGLVAQAITERRVDVIVRYSSLGKAERFRLRLFVAPGPVSGMQVARIRVTNQADGSVLADSGRVPNEAPSPPLGEPDT
jgi:hypothetical protein